MKSATGMKEVAWQNGHGPKAIQVKWWRDGNRGAVCVANRLPQEDWTTDLGRLLYNLSKDPSYYELQDSSLRRKICQKYKKDPDLMCP